MVMVRMFFVSGTVKVFVVFIGVFDFFECLNFKLKRPKVLSFRLGTLINSRTSKIGIETSCLCGACEDKLSNSRD